MKKVLVENRPCLIYQPDLEFDNTPIFGLVPGDLIVTIGDKSKNKTSSNRIDEFKLAVVYLGIIEIEGLGRCLGFNYAKLILLYGISECETEIYVSLLRSQCIRIYKPVFEKIDYEEINHN